jgi:hypothetical protein
MSILDDERVRRLDYGYSVLSPRLGLVRVYPLPNGLWAGFVDRYEPGTASLEDAIGGSSSYSADDTIEWALR